MESATETCLEIKQHKRKTLRGKGRKAIKAVANYIKCDESELHAEREGLAYSNAVYKVYRGEKKYLYKEYMGTSGSEAAELQWQKYFEMPKILYESAKYRIDEYIEHRPLTKQLVKCPHILRNIAKQVAKIHGAKTPVEIEEKDYFQTIVKERCSLRNKICSSRFMEICNKIEKKIKKLCCESLFKDSLHICHNDLQFGNILVLPTQDILIIDFEHLSTNILTVDIANFFNEASTNYKARGAPVSKNHFMNTEYARVFLTEYFKERSINISISKVLKEIERVRSIPYYYWFIWAVKILVQEKKQPGLDYFLFAMQRLQYLEQDNFITQTNVKELRSCIVNRK